MPIAINAIPTNPLRRGAFSPRHMAATAVNRKLHEFAIGTATDSSELCSAKTYNTLPHWFNRNGKIYCQRVTMNFNSSKTFVSLLFATIASIPTEPRLMSGFVAPHRNPTTTNTIFWAIDIVGTDLLSDWLECSCLPPGFFLRIFIFCLFSVRPVRTHCLYQLTSVM